MPFSDNALFILQKLYFRKDKNGNLKKSGAAEIIYVKIKGSKDEVEKKLIEMENVVKVKIKDKEAENIYGYEIEPASGVDLRECLSLTVMKNNWSILEFKKISASLENVFRELTK